MYGDGDNGKTGTLIKNIICNNGRKVYLHDVWEEKPEFNKGDEYEIIQLSSRRSVYEESYLDILVQVSSECRNLQSVTGNIKPGGYIILNSDFLDRIDLKCREIYAVSYGLNNKATVTASSIDDIQGLSFSYYLQRALPSMEKVIIQPFETPIRFSHETCDIYSCLAAYTCAIILGFKI